MIGSVQHGPMPSEISQIFHRLRNEIKYINAKIQIFLLTTHPEAHHIASTTSSKFFHMVIILTARDLIATFCNLTDKAKTGNKDNLTLEQLIRSIPVTNQDEQDLTALLENKLVEINDSISHFRDHRNRGISHFDLLTSLNQHPDEMGKINILNFRLGLSLITEFMNEIEFFYTGERTTYDDLGMKDDIEFLVNCLNYGLEYKKQAEHQ